VVLKDVDVTFPSLSVSAVIGKSGSGKSSLIQTIIGLIKPTKGELLIDGLPLASGDLSSFRKKVGYVVQHTGLFPHLTVFDNITLQGIIHSHSLSTRSTRYKELMDMLSLPISFQHRYPYELSGGEQQRVGIGRALYFDPPLLLMDEPFGALDALTRSELHQQLLKLQSVKARTVVLVTHDIREALLLAKAILVLEKGEVQQFAHPDVLLASPANTPVKLFIDSLKA